MNAYKYVHGARAYDLSIILTPPLTMLLALGYFSVLKMKLLYPVDHPESMSTAPTWRWYRGQCCSARQGCGWTSHGHVRGTVQVCSIAFTCTVHTLSHAVWSQYPIFKMISVQWRIQQHTITEAMTPQHTTKLHQWHWIIPQWCVCGVHAYTQQLFASRTAGCTVDTRHTEMLWARYSFAYSIVDSWFARELSSHTLHAVQCVQSQCAWRRPGVDTLLHCWPMLHVTSASTQDEMDIQLKAYMRLKVQMPACFI